MKITQKWFDKDYIYGLDGKGTQYRQSLLRIHILAGQYAEATF